jgi:hypothetical protein
VQPAIGSREQAMRLGTCAYSTHTFLSIEINANAADVSGKVQTIHECDSSRF